MGCAACWALAATSPAAGVTVRASDAPVILVMGDSLSAGYGIDHDAGWVNLLRRRLDRRGYDYRVINASISGETSAAGLARLPQELQRHHPAVMILELGANDGLQGLPLARMRENLTDMIRRSRAAGAAVLLIGVRLPPNYGPRYTSQFEQAYRELARRYDVAFVPFLMEGFGTDMGRFQADGLHPNAGAQPAMLDNIWPRLKPLLQGAAAN